MKNDTKKPAVELIEGKFILGVGSVLGFGAEKYGRDNWKRATLEDVERVKGALLRHTVALMDGEKIDPESGLSHTYHIGCNAMFLDYFSRHGIEATTRDDGAANAMP